MKKIYIKPTVRVKRIVADTPQIRNPTKVSERCGPNRQECDFSSSD